MSPPRVKKEISIKQMSASFVNIYLKICFSLHIPRRISTIEIIDEGLELLIESSLILSSIIL